VPEVQSHRLGDKLQTALKLVGVTEERVEKFVGKPCGCKERILKLNQLDAWARRVVSGKVERAKHYFEQIVGANDE